jgi:hypothetical protein
VVTGEQLWSSADCIALQLHDVASPWSMLVQERPVLFLSLGSLTMEHAGAGTKLAAEMGRHS